MSSSDSWQVTIMRHQVFVKDFRLNNRKTASLFIRRMIVITVLNQSSNNISIIIQLKGQFYLILSLKITSVPTLTASTEYPG